MSTLFLYIPAFFGANMSIWVIFIAFALLSWIVLRILKSKFKKYSTILLPNGLTGKAVAEKMLRDNGITNVSTYPMATDALRWAAYTYVIAALGSLATLVYYIMIFLGGARRN